MEHCQQVVCGNCGAMYCVLNCGVTRFPDDAIAEQLKKLLKQEYRPHHFMNNRCPYCTGQQVYEYPAQMPKPFASYFSTN